MALLETLSEPFKKARLTNQTSNGYVSKVPTATEPTGDANTATGSAVIDLTRPEGGVVQNSILAVFYGVGSNDNTFSCRVIGWRKVGTDPNSLVWVPVVLVEYAVTLSSTPVGILSRDISSTEIFADTISLTTGNDDVSTDVVSPTGNVIAHAVFDAKGFTKLEFSFTTGGSATSCNALWAPL